MSSSVNAYCDYSYSTTRSGCDEQCVNDFHKKYCPDALCKYYGESEIASLYCPVDEACFIVFNALKNPVNLLLTRFICEGIGEYHTSVSVNCKQIRIQLKIWINNKRTSCNLLSSTLTFARCRCSYCYDCVTQYVVTEIYCSCRAGDHLPSSPSTVKREMYTPTDIPSSHITLPEVIPSEIPSPESTSPKITSPDITSSHITLPEDIPSEIPSPESTSPKITSPDITSTEFTSSKFTSPNVKTTVVGKTSVFSPTTLAVGSSNIPGATEGAVSGAAGLLLLIFFILFALCFRKRRARKSKSKNTQPTVINRMYDTHSGSLIASQEENHTVPHDYDYVDSAVAANVQQHNTTAEITQSNDYDFAKPFQPDPEENSFTLNPSEVARHQETIIEESSEMHNMYENDSRVLLHHGYSNTMQ